MKKLVQRLKNGQIVGEIERSEEWIEQNAMWIALNGFVAVQEEEQPADAGVYVPVEVSQPVEPVILEQLSETETEVKSKKITKTKKQDEEGRGEKGGADNHD